MSDFRRYEKVVSYVPSHLARDSDALQARISEFREKTSDIIEDVIKKFMQEGVFPNLKTVSFLRESSKAGDKIFAPICLFFTGHGFEVGECLARDKEGIAVAKSVATAAKKLNVPIRDCLSYVIIDSKQKVENGPKVLLLALAAYALEINKGSLAAYANDAATEVKELIKGFDGIQQAK